MLKVKIPLKQGELLTAEKITKRSDTFITKANKYLIIDELTTDILNVFIDKIVIHEKVVKYSRDAVQMIDIHYLDVGMLDYINEEKDRKKQII